MRRTLTILSIVVLSVLLVFQVALAQATATVARNANLRAGPGTNYAVVGGVKTGQAVTIVGSNPAGNWYQLDTGQWIATFLVHNVSGDVPLSADTGVVRAATPVTPTGQAALVTRIIDGDTIDVSISSQSFRVRYILVNTPEVGQPFYAEAAEANRVLVAGKTVYLVKDVSETDRYGRLLRYVYLADGTFVNRELVGQGYAQLATFPPDVTKEKEIRAAQQEAVAVGRGLWAGEADTTTALPVVQPTAAATVAPVKPTNTPTAQPTVTPVPQAPATTGSTLRIVSVNKRDEYVDIANQGGSAVNLSGWRLFSEKGAQDCSLSGTIEPGQTLRIWAMAENAGNGGYNCGHGSNIWNNSERDPAVLFDSSGAEVSRFE